MRLIFWLKNFNNKNFQIRLMLEATEFSLTIVRNWTKKLMFCGRLCFLHAKIKININMHARMIRTVHGYDLCELNRDSHMWYKMTFSYITMSETEVMRITDKIFMSHFGYTSSIHIKRANLLSSYIMRVFFSFLELHKFITIAIFSRQNKSWFSACLINH